MGQDVAVKRRVFLGVSVQVDGRKGEELPKEQDDTAQDGGEQEGFHDVEVVGGMKVRIQGG